MYVNITCSIYSNSGYIGPLAGSSDNFEMGPLKDHLCQV